MPSAKNLSPDQQLLKELEREIRESTRAIKDYASKNASTAQQREMARRTQLLKDKYSLLEKVGPPPKVLDPQKVFERICEVSDSWPPEWQEQLLYRLCAALKMSPPTELL